MTTTSSKGHIGETNIAYEAVLVVGDNGNGQLGFADEDVTEKKRAVKAEIPTEKAVTAIATGSMHSVIVVRKDRVDELLTAGCGDDGQLGRSIPPESDAERSFQRATINGLNKDERFIAVSCSDNATFALSNNGRLFVTGSFRDRNGHFRVTRSEERRLEFSPLSLPAEVGRAGSGAKQGPRITQVAAGGNFALLLTENGDVMSFGVGECGELGRLPASERLRSRVSADDYFEPLPILVPPGLKFDRIFAGEFTAFARVDLSRSSARIRTTLLAAKSHSHGAAKRPREEEEAEHPRSSKIAKTETGTASGSSGAGASATRSKRVSNARAYTEPSGSVLFVFGLNNRGQLALDEPLGEVRKPTAIHLPFRCEKVAAGQHHTLFLDADGFVYAVGRPEYGRLGLDALDNDVIGIPRRIEALPYAEAGGCVDIAATIENSFAVMRDGTAYSFGAPNSILGLGYSNDDDHEPELVPALMRSKALNEYEVLAVSAGSQHALLAVNLKPNGNPNVTMNVSTISTSK